ncbi:MAG: thiamine phosphate synthase [Anaerovoracaceae bacterium]
MKCDKKYMRLYAVTDRGWIGKKTLAMQVEEAIKGGATCIQLREKEMNDEDFLKEALEIKSLCQTYHVPLFINDNVDVAMKCGADGIHVGQQDMEVSHVRQKISKNMILGVSTQTVEQARMAERNGANYLGVGAVFTTATKLDADSVSTETLKAICKAVSIPVVAIGGINKQNIIKLSGTGIDGVALVSSIFASEDIESECRQLRALADAMVTK